jgi:hypothetical protein
MTQDYFGQLEDELGALMREGAHLDRPERTRRQAVTLVRRGAATVALALALAASLAGEFPAAANGFAAVTHASLVRSA